MRQPPLLFELLHRHQDRGVDDLLTFAELLDHLGHGRLATVPQQFHHLGLQVSQAMQRSFFHRASYLRRYDVRRWILAKPRPRQENSLTADGEGNRASPGASASPTARRKNRLRTPVGLSAPHGIRCQPCSSATLPTMTGSLRSRMHAARANSRSNVNAPVSIRPDQKALHVVPARQRQNVFRSACRRAVQVVCGGDSVVHLLFQLRGPAGDLFDRPAAEGRVSVQRSSSRAGSFPRSCSCMRFTAPLAGQVGDRFPRKLVIMAGLYVWMRVTGFTALCTDFLGVCRRPRCGGTGRDVLFSGVDVAGQRLPRQGHALAR